MSTAGDRRGRASGRPSMTQVAALAGVSAQTVSRVVSGGARVKPATRERIESAIRELGYRRNNAARTLATHRSGLIGVVAVGSFLFGPTRTLAGIEEAARARDFTTLLATIRPEAGGDLSGEFERALDTCLDRSVEAIIVIAAQEDVVAQVSAFAVDVPLIVVGPPRAHLPGLSTLSVDQLQGARSAVAHLADRGHSDLLLLSGPQSWIDARERYAGALAECAVRGISPRTVEGDWSAESGFRLGQELASGRRAMPTAVFSANDTMALGLLAAFHEAGVRVPHDVSLVGFDDIPESAYFSPALTTVHQDFTALGHRVVAALAEAASGGVPDMSPVTPTLMVRHSTAPRESEDN